MRVNRVVTGTDEANRSTIIRSGHHDNLRDLSEAGVEIVELWRTEGAVADNFGEEDTGLRPFVLDPPAAGTVFRLCRFQPETAAAAAARIAAASKREKASLDRRFHITRTTDYIVVVEGEIWAEMEEGEVLLKQGDALIQRGTIHAWSNRSTAPCTIACVLVDAAPLAGRDLLQKAG